MESETRKSTARAKPEKRQSTELRIAAWVPTMLFGVFVALLLFAPLIHYLRELPEGLTVLVGAAALLLFLAAGIGYGSWLGGEGSSSRLPRRSPPWAGEDSYIEIRLPKWIGELLLGVVLSLFPIVFVRIVVPPHFFPFVAGLLLLTGNGFAIWLHPRLHGKARKDSPGRDA